MLWVYIATYSEFSVMLNENNLSGNTHWTNEHVSMGNLSDQVSGLQTILLGHSQYPFLCFHLESRARLILIHQWILLSSCSQVNQLSGYIAFTVRNPRRIETTSLACLSRLPLWAVFKSWSDLISVVSMTKDAGFTSFFKFPPHFSVPLYERSKIESVFQSYSSSPPTAKLKDYRL